MKSLIFDVLVRILVPIIWLMSLWIFFRGHDAAGGGFIAGLMAAMATTLQILSLGRKGLDRFHRTGIFSMLGIGLLVSVSSSISNLVRGQAFMTAEWLSLGKFPVGTPIIFDVGIFITVYAAVVICISQLLLESEQEVSTP